MTVEALLRGLATEGWEPVAFPLTDEQKQARVERVDAFGPCRDRPGWAVVRLATSAGPVEFSCPARVPYADVQRTWLGRMAWRLYMAGVAKLDNPKAARAKYVKLPADVHRALLAATCAELVAM